MKFWKREQGAAKYCEMEQGAKRDEKGAVKISQKERAPKNGSREKGVKYQREQGA